MHKDSQQALMASLQKNVQESRDIQEEFFSKNWDMIAEVSERIVSSLRAGGKVLIMGNGGSAADAQHVAAELVCRYQKNRPSLPAIALTTDSSLLTAIGNDFDFRYTFSKQIEGLGKPEDIVIAISTSGNSPNVLEGVEQAKGMGIHTLALTGGTGGRIREIADQTLCVSATGTTARIQETLLILEHLLCEWIETEMFPDH